MRKTVFINDEDSEKMFTTVPEDVYKYKVYMHQWEDYVGNRYVYIGITKQDDVESRWRHGYGYKTQKVFQDFRNCAYSFGKSVWDFWDDERYMKHVVLMEGVSKNCAELWESYLIKGFARWGKFIVTNSNYGHGWKYLLVGMNRINWLVSVGDEQDDVILELHDLAMRALEEIRDVNDKYDEIYERNYETLEKYNLI